MPAFSTSLILSGVSLSLISLSLMWKRAHTRIHIGDGGGSNKIRGKELFFFTEQPAPAPRSPASTNPNRRRHRLQPLPRAASQGTAAPP